MLQANLEDFTLRPGNEHPADRTCAQTLPHQRNGCLSYRTPQDYGLNFKRAPSPSVLCL